MMLSAKQLIFAFSILFFCGAFFLAPKKIIPLEDTLSKVPLERAEQFTKLAMTGGKLKYGIEAVDIFREILEKEPENKRALHGIAELSLRSGAGDKALEFYERLLNLEPENDKNIVDLGLTYLQLGRGDLADLRFKEALKKNPKNFEALLGLSLAARAEGNLEDAKLNANQALLVAPSPLSKKRIEEFLFSLNSAKTSDPLDKNLTKRDVVKNIVVENPVLSQKFKNIDWTNEEQVIIHLNEFPIASMPEFARKKIAERFLNAFQDRIEKFELILQDDTSGDTLKIDVNRK